MDAPVVKEVRDVIEHGKVPARITDLHVWRVGRARYACVMSLTTSSPQDSDYFRRELGVHEELAHVTVEVEHLRSPPP
jgi:Co/Zn/Cd efflux system component